MSTCGVCKHGSDTKPGGQKPSPGTAWCLHRGVQMAKNRQMPCFVPVGGVKPKHCIDCKKSRIIKPSGETPQLGNVWCEKKHAEINKHRSMECFE
ncbi:MAG: hypothetical protein HZA17_00100 [Nitrospirae bacterium]|nr:hypothetical protein [Nitrospirota bacterium]